MLVLYNLRLGLYHSLTNRLAEGLLSAGTILVTQGEVHRAGTSLVLVESRVNQQVEGIKDNHNRRRNWIVTLLAGWRMVQVQEWKPTL